MKVVSRHKNIRISRGLHPRDALLVGILHFSADEPFSVTVPPRLSLRVWCPFCKRIHSHEWKDDVIRFDQLGDHRRAHCLGPAAPLAASGYHIGLDISRKAENVRILAAYADHCQRRVNWLARRKTS
jgi:hypothetical protein